MCPESLSLPTDGRSPKTESLRSSLRILVVDDERAILEALTNVLRASGHKVLPALCLSIDDVDGILHDVTAFPFDVAIIGTVMPGIDGMALSELLNRASPATALILAVECCVEHLIELMRKGLYVQILPVPFEPQEIKEALNCIMSARHRNGLVHRIDAPKEAFQLEEGNLPTELVKSLAGRCCICVDMLREEQPRTRKVEPDDFPLLIDPQGNYWNDYRPFRVLYTDDQHKVWRFRKIWLPGLRPPTENHVRWEGSQVKTGGFCEALNLPTEWDLGEINIPWETSHPANKGQVEVEVHTSTDHPPKVFWRDPSGSVWRIPNDWRKRRIRLPESDILISQGLPISVARAYGGQVVSVNYHPGSICCLPDQYRFRDDRGRRWPVRIEDCFVLGFGNH